MISAENFAKQNEAWHRSVPTLENYMRWLNRNVRGFNFPVTSLSDPDRNSLLSEAAFYALFSTKESAETEARTFVSKLPKGQNAVARLSRAEVGEVEQLRLHLAEYIGDRSSNESLVFQPEFPGCGVVEAARGDILLGEELIEIKAVQRTFRSSDLRQTLTYAALAYSAGRVVSKITLLNPRRGTFFTSKVEDVAMDAGAGSWVGLMRDLIDAMTTFEVSL